MSFSPVAFSPCTDGPSAFSDASNMTSSGAIEFNNQMEQKVRSKITIDT